MVMEEKVFQADVTDYGTEVVVADAEPNTGAAAEGLFRECLHKYNAVSIKPCLKSFLAEHEQACWYWLFKMDYTIIIGGSESKSKLKKKKKKNKHKHKHKSEKKDRGDSPKQERMIPATIVSESMLELSEPSSADELDL